MNTVAELDGRISERRARVGELRAQMQALAIQAMTDGRALAERMRAREELDCVPAQIGELTRLRTLAQFAAWQTRVAELRPEYERADALDNDYRAANAAYRHDVSFATSETQRQELQRAWHGISDASQQACASYQKLRGELLCLYQWAAQAGVFLDQTKEQYQFASILPPVAHAAADSAAHWQTMAKRAGERAEDAARREFVGHVLTPQAWK